MIQYGEDKYKEELKLLWKLCFPDDSETFIHFYFEEVYTNEDTLVLIEEGKIVSSLQMIPYPIKIGSTINLAGYISGAMTHPNYQKKGYMGQLLNASFKEMKEKGYNYTFLIPQQDWLFNYYGQFGYNQAFPIHQSTLLSAPDKTISSNLLRDKTIQVYKSLNEIEISDFYTIYSRFLMQQKNVVLKTKQQVNNILWDLFEGQGLLLYNDWGMAFVYPQKDKTIIREFFFYDEEIKQEYLFFMGQSYPLKNIFYYNNPNAPFLNYKGMIKNLDGNTQLPADIYMSMMLD